MTSDRLMDYLRRDRVRIALNLCEETSFFDKHLVHVSKSAYMDLIAACRDLIEYETGSNGPARRFASDS